MVIDMRSLEALGRTLLDVLTAGSVDPQPLGEVRRPGHNVGLSDGEILSRIVERNRQGLPTYLLRYELEQRLNQLGELD